MFRRYIDFSAVQSLRRMKAMIGSEVRRRGLTNNIKLGAGGFEKLSLSPNLSNLFEVDENRVYVVEAY